MNYGRFVWTGIFISRTLSRNSKFNGGSSFSNEDRQIRLEVKDKLGMFDQMWGPHHIDLFANRHNTQLTRYYSWTRAEAVNAFHQNWAHMNLWYKFIITDNVTIGALFIGSVRIW